MKKYLLGLFAIALAVGFSAFTQSTNKKIDGNRTVYSYKFIGTQATEAQFESAANWSTTISGCTSGSKPCRVDVLDQPTINDFVTFLQGEPSAATYVNLNTISTRP